MAEKQRILIVDDDANIAELISLYLMKECYETMIVGDGEEALKRFPEFKPNLVLLDLMLPGMDGYQVCRELRSSSQVPIIMLSAKGEIFDKVLGLELGADDYMIKPFDSKELVARVKAVLRRYQASPAAAITEPKQQGDYVEYPDLIVNLTNYSVIYKGHSIEMPPKELELLYFLASSPNQVFTREQLLDHIWGYEYIGDTRTVDVHIKRLREKIKDHASWAITTVWGIGYKFEVMARSLYSKFVLGYLIFGLLSVLTIATFSSGITRDYLIKDRANALYDEANDIAASCSLMYQGQHQDMDLFSTQLKNVSTYLHTETWVVNKSGVVIMDSKNGSRVHTTIPDFDPTATGNRSYTIGTYYKLFDQNVLSVSAPVTGNYTTYGYVLIHLPISEIANSQSHILDILYMTCAIIFGLSLIILVVFTITVYLPLRKIAAGANEYAAGNLNYRIKVKTHDEMGYLSNTLNYMSDELNKMEEYQRNFIANVSHDFRSPLTSIKGYLEAILDGTIPPEMYEKYLSRVISETERLHKLTESMLTLNSLDAKGFLSRTNFDINRVIKDTAASFEGTCDSRHIRFDLTFSDNIQMVYADMGKIQQVLYNLIDNAIKFSHDDSVIYIQASSKYEKIFVSVKDTGIGIPRDSIKKIWDRFYKTDLSRGKDKRGTGLGLSIVKEIIQAHGENIDVISTEGVGTEFIFSLPSSTSL